MIIQQHRYSLNKLFIQENVYDDVLQRLEARFNKLKVGNHLDKCNDCGPILNAAEFKEVIEAQATEFEAEVYFQIELDLIILKYLYLF